MLNLEREASWAAAPGHCYVVSTPLGNLGDITARAVLILKSVSLIACEDTRVTRKLLQYLEVERPLISYRDENERLMAETLVERLKNNDSIALVSDAGTPTINDPGFRLVRACRKAGVPVVPLPGPCALIAALSASGLPTDAFFFAGFVPPKSGGRQAFFESHLETTHTVVAYESCHRVERSLEAAFIALGPDRVVAVARELTKRFESFYVGPLSQVKEQCSADPFKGEYVLIIAPKGFIL